MRAAAHRQAFLLIDYSSARLYGVASAPAVARQQRYRQCARLLSSITTPAAASFQSQPDGSFPARNTSFEQQAAAAGYLRSTLAAQQQQQQQTSIPQPPAAYSSQSQNFDSELLWAGYSDLSEQLRKLHARQEAMQQHVEELKAKLREKQQQQQQPSAWQAASFLLFFLGFINFAAMLANFQLGMFLPWVAVKPAGGVLAKQLISTMLPLTNTVVSGWGRCRQACTCTCAEACWGHQTGHAVLSFGWLQQRAMVGAVHLKSLQKSYSKCSGAVHVVHQHCMLAS